MESSVSPDSSLSGDTSNTESSVEETRSWDSEHVEDAFELPRKSELGEGDTRPSEEFDEERELKKPADLKEMSGEENGYERSDAPKLPEDYVEETNNNEGDEKTLQAPDDCTLAGIENTFLEHISAEVINGDCCEVKDDLHQSENSEGKGQVEEVQTADDPERTESVKNEESEMGIPIQDSEHEPSVAKSVAPDEVADQKSVESAASGSENDDEQDIAVSWPETKSLSVDTKSDNYESESREGNAKQINVNSGISIEFSPEPESETASFHFDPRQAADDVNQIEESSDDFVLDPVSTPELDGFLEPASTSESDSLLALRNNEDLNPDSFLEPASTPNSDSLLAFRNNDDLNQDSFLKPASTPESDSLLALRNKEDLNVDSFLNFASAPESDSLLALRNNEDLNPDSFLESASTAESDSLLAHKNSEDLDADSTELASLSVPGSDSLSIFRNGKDAMAESAEAAKLIYTDADESSNQLATSTIDSTLDELLGAPFDAEEKGEEPKEMTEPDYGLTEGKEENLPFYAEKLPQMGFEVDGTDTKEMEDNTKRTGNTIDYEGDSSPAAESGAKNNEEDAQIVGTKPLNVAAGDQTYTDKSILVENEGSVVTESGNRDQQTESEIQIEARENIDQNRKDSEKSRGIFLRQIWSCCGVLEWMRTWRD